MSGSACQSPLVLQKQVRVYLSVDPKGVDILRADLRNVCQVGHYGTGDLELSIMAKENIECFVDLFEAIYRNP